jgi:hypothetical protein
LQLLQICPRYGLYFIGRLISNELVLMWDQHAM